MNRRFRLEQAVHDARERTGVPGVAAGFSHAGESAFAAAGVRVLGEPEPVSAGTPFRIASISKPFTATLAARCLELDDELCALLSHTAGLRCESAEPLPESCLGLWSYSNAGYWAAGTRAAEACGSSFSDAMRSQVLEPLELGATGYDEPAAAARGHVQEGETGQRAVLEDAYPVTRRPSGGLWSTVADLVRFGEHQLDADPLLHEPRAEALGAGYALGWWVRDLGGRTALDHEGSVGGYQSLLLLVPEERLVLAVLTNSWRGSGRDPPHRRGARSRTRGRRTGADPGIGRGRLRAGRRRGDDRRRERRAARDRGGDGSGHRLADRTALSGPLDRRRCLRLRGRRAAKPSARRSARGRRPRRLARFAAGLTVIAGVAAGHPATARAGVEILADGGNAADAAVAAALASCVAETVMTGLLGGGHAIYYDAATGAARNLDFFCAVPGLGTEWHDPELVHLEVPFGAELVHYAVGPASCAVPGVPAGLGSLWDAHGRLPWRRLVEPALQLARSGVAMPEAHVACLRMLEPVMTLREGARMYAPGGTLLEPGELLAAAWSRRGARARSRRKAQAVRTTARSARRCSSSRASAAVSSPRTISHAYAATWSMPVETTRLERALPHARRPLRRSRDDHAVAAHFAGCHRPSVVVRSSTRSTAAPGPETHTTNLVTVDRDGNACVLTTSLGLGSGDWLPGLDLHLNSMLGETDLLRGALVAGARMHSMMAPTLVFDGAQLELAIGAAGGTRLRTALVTVATAILDEGLEPQAAVDRPRVHVADGVANAEPGVDEDGLSLLEARGIAVRRWPERHHYFGGVSAAAAAGAAADPRRSGAALPAPAAG